MRSIARVSNSQGKHTAEVEAGPHRVSIGIEPKPTGLGSGVSGGELLMLALATCYCNDIYREAAEMKIEVTAVEVECSADFPAAGSPAESIRYSARIAARASKEEIRGLAERADGRAEIQNSVRSAIPVALTEVDAQTV